MTDLTDPIMFDGRRVFVDDLVVEVLPGPEHQPDWVSVHVFRVCGDHFIRLPVKWVKGLEYEEIPSIRDVIRERSEGK